MIEHKHTTAAGRALRGLLLAACAAPLLAQAALTGIADEPLVTQPELRPKPNMLVILDDSGSMGYGALPDAMDIPIDLGYREIGCNGAAYNPNYTYAPPKKHDGTSYPDAVFERALQDGFNPHDAVTNPEIDLGAETLLIGASGNPYFKVRLTAATMPTVGVKTLTFSTTLVHGTILGPKSFVVGDTINFQRAPTDTSRLMSGVIQAWDFATLKLTVDFTSASGVTAGQEWTIEMPGQLYYVYKGTDSAADRKWTYHPTTSNVISTLFTRQCLSGRSAGPGADTKVMELNMLTANSSAAEKTNYANWYSYYRTRQLMMRSAMGVALLELDDKYRLGFMTINKRTEIAGAESLSFRPVKDFDAGFKKDFYDSLYQAGADGNTPLRNALSYAGRYFANQLTGQETDPVQYACQRNYALLTTDGYWNGAIPGQGFLLTGGMWNAPVGNQDGSAGAPYQDDWSGTLADIAYHYYTTDLRTPALGNCTGASIGGNPGLDVCSNILLPAGKDDATHQHMTTFSIGFGVTGLLDLSADPMSITWPEPLTDKANTVDDLWHAAVNGRGDYYSAQNVEQLSTAFQGILETVSMAAGAGSATATSALDLVAGGGNLAFEGSYTTGTWYGDLLARKLDANTALALAGAPEWSARSKLDAMSAAARAIYFSNGTELKEFKWSELGATLQAHFKDACTGATPKLSQCAGLSAGQQTTVNAGEELVLFLRGKREHEIGGSGSLLFRKRTSKLGDIINSKPIHVAAPPFDYADAGYAAFRTAQAGRRKMVYVGANDGMLHAFDAATGEELWAFVPTAVMPNMYRLADADYGRTLDRPHTYYVDGKTVQGDVYFDGAWRTMLVGGLNKGGRAYYALDITDPAAPTLLWEFSDNNLGLSYSEPVITKLGDGTWVVAFGSGYNNASPGDGKGRLFVLNAKTGAIVRNIATSAGDATTPAGLAHINVWVKALNDNTALRFYGGDLLGNLWRFDTDNLVLPHMSALLLAKLQDADGKAQPITTEPKLREFGGQPVVVVASGRYLQRDDIDDKSVQSIAAVRDPLTSSGWGVLRSSSNFSQVTISASGTTASGAGASIDWANKGGWWADFPAAGERVVTPMAWDGVHLLVGTAIPQGDQCKSGGSSWFYGINLGSGLTQGEEFSTDRLIVGFSVLRTAGGQPKILVRTSDGATHVKEGTGLGSGTSVKRARRVSWRELLR